MGKKKRQRSESFQGEQDGDGDARKRLAAFHARMFELPQEDAMVAAPETPRVLFKSKHKKRKKKSAGGDDADDGEPVPMVKLNMSKPKKKKKVAAAVEVQEEKKKTVVTGPAVVKAPGMLKTNSVKKKDKKVVDQVVKKLEKKVQKKKQVAAIQAVKKTTQVKTVAVWHSIQKDDAEEENDGVDPLEQALGSMREMVTKQVAKPPYKKHKTVTGKAVAVPKTEKLKEIMKPVQGNNSTRKASMESIVDGDTTGHLFKRNKKCRKKRKKMEQLAAMKINGSNPPTAGAMDAHAKEGKKVSPEANGKPTPTDLMKKTPVKDVANNASTAPSPKSPGSRKKRKKSPKVNAMNNVSPKTHAPAQPRQGKPLIISDKPESKVVSRTDTAKDANTVISKKANTAPAKKGKTASKPAVPPTKTVVSNDEKKTAVSSQPLTPIAASLAKGAKKKDDMFLPTRETPRRSPVSSKRVEKAAAPQVVQLTDESSSESEDDGAFDVDHNDSDNASLFSRLIDSAARERWELVEVGRLVRLFAAEWGFNGSTTARFLCETCPELVSVDFLEGLGVNLSSKQLVQIFEAGSGNSGVLMNKMASAVENGHLSVRDPTFVSALERRVALMESNAEVMELLYPLLESLSTVRDVGCLLKQLCEHWQLERKIALVQQVLLSNVFDDLDGNQDEILLDLPNLTGRLDFPSRLDQEDVDENGNLKGFLANEDSEFSGEEVSEEELDEVDSEDDEDQYEGETDSEEEVEISGRSRGRNQFIEDEADVGEEDEEDEEKQRHDDDASSSSDSD